MMHVPYIDLGIQHKLIKDELIKEIESVLTSGQFILGKFVEDFEQQFARTCQTSYAIGVANGTDALILAMKALKIGPGDEVITAPNSYLASASSIALAGAIPVFADVRDDLNLDPEKAEKAITKKTKAIIPVHLTGRPAPMNEINALAKKYGLYVIEDAAQSIGAEYHNRRTGSLGHIGCFSLHPLKNLSACGDGGMITTNDRNLYEKIRVLRNHGLKSRDECTVWSLNSRLDAMQATILSVKVKYLEPWTTRRRFIASWYQQEFHDCVKTPVDRPYEKAVYHTFIIQTNKRDALKDHLQKNGIDSRVHYPIPIHLQEAAMALGYSQGSFPITEKLAGEILSLPIYPELTDEQVLYIIHQVKSFFDER
jgi:dTDP-4-amino-4,6-dideoxygalactose transaminase